MFFSTAWSPLTWQIFRERIRTRSEGVRVWIAGRVCSANFRRAFLILIPTQMKTQTHTAGTRARARGRRREGADAYRSVWGGLGGKAGRRKEGRRERRGRERDLGREGLLSRQSLPERIIASRAPSGASLRLAYLIPKHKHARATAAWRPPVSASRDCMRRITRESKVAHAPGAQRSTEAVLHSAAR